MLIDSHCHLPNNESAIKNILKEANENDVKNLVVIGTSIEENETVIEIINNFADIYGTIGIYPNSDREKDVNETIEQLKNQLKKSNKIVGIGECGIDITNWENQRPVEEQIQLFKLQIDLALTNNLPIVIHNRNGDAQVLKILNEYEGKVKGIAHCFDSSWETAKKLLDLNMYISFSGFITYNSKKYLLETVKNTPLDRILVETDSPYIVPKGVKEKQNTPKNVRITAQKVADVKELSLDDVMQATFKNTCEAYSNLCQN
jgi:TatD DNase family protein